MSGHTEKRNSENETSFYDGTRPELFISDGIEASDREYARVFGAQPHQWTEEEIRVAQEENAPHPFSFLR